MLNCFAFEILLFDQIYHFVKSIHVCTPLNFFNFLLIILTWFAEESHNAYVTSTLYKVCFDIFTWCKHCITSFCNALSSICHEIVRVRKMKNIIMNFVGFMLSFCLAGVGFFYLIQNIAIKKSFRSVEVYFLRPYYVCSSNPFFFRIYTSAPGFKVFSLHKS